MRRAIPLVIAGRPLHRDRDEGRDFPPGMPEDVRERYRDAWECLEATVDDAMVGMLTRRVRERSPGAYARPPAPDWGHWRVFDREDRCVCGGETEIDALRNALGTLPIS